MNGHDESASDSARIAGLLWLAVAVVCGLMIALPYLQRWGA